MSGSTISTTISENVTLGSASYLSPLTVTGTGLIDPPPLSINFVVVDGLFTETVAGIGVLSTIAAPYLDNLGIILGSTAASFTDVGQTIGGFGVFFTSGGTVLNSGTISGGAGAQFGTGVAIDGIGTLINTGSISGGYGRYNGGGGAYSSGSLLNDGVITGGASHEQAGEGFGGSDGDITNNGTILGGNGGTRGEIGVALGNSSTLINNGVIRAGNGGEFGEIGVYVVGARTNVTIINTSLISGGYGSFASGPGVNIAANSLLNTGVIMGASGPDYAANGVDAFGNATITNYGTLLGGTGTAKGGDGFSSLPPDFFVPAAGNDIVTNTGSIIGGSGTIAGEGVYLYVQSTLNNQGTIIGGYGATYGNGVRLESGDEVINGTATDTSALILGNDGVEIQGTSASALINNATIAGRTTGVFLQQTVSAANSIINAASGTITGKTCGVYFDYSPSIASNGLFTNAGQISAGVDGVVETGLGGTILNTGTIIARDPSKPYAAEGIAIGGSADIINGSSAAANALILGYNGVVIGGGSSLINYGTIGANEMGLQIRQTGSLSAGVINEASGTIIGDYYGVDLNSGYTYSPGLFTNAGEIIGKYCAFNESGLGGTILNTGTIAGLGAGPSGISNAIIIGGGADIFNGSSNATGALISGTGFGAGILMFNQSGVTGASVGTVTNYGTVLGGVHLPAGTVINTGMSALIAGGAVAAYNQLFKGDGVYGLQNSTVINTGVIQGGLGTIANDGNGVYLGSQGSLNNQGAIFGGNDDTLGSGVLVKSGDIITNGAATDASAVIVGYNGVDIQGNSSLINYGAITGANYGLLIQQTISAPASVINEASGTIMGTGLNFGVYLRSASSFATTGTFTNAGQISGGIGGLAEYGLGGTILNTGTIAGTGFGTTPPLGDGIFIEGGAEVINGSSAITNAELGGKAGGFGIDMITPFGGTIASLGTVINYGTIGGSLQIGVQLVAGTVINGTVIDSKALITGIAIGGNALVENFGTVNGDGRSGPALEAFGGGNFLNGSANDTAALIEGNAFANVELGNATLTNFGSIIGGTINGVSADAGIISNAVSGVIIGGKFGANVGGGGGETLLNAGLIAGTIGISSVAYYAYSNIFSNSGTVASLLGGSGTAIAFGKGDDLLIDDPTGVFIGTVSGGAGDNTIELASGGLGTLAGIGSQFSQFTNIDLDPGASWLLEGDIAGLASGQTLNGFAQPAGSGSGVSTAQGDDAPAPGNTIILDGFTETSFAYVAGTGLELTGGDAASAVIDIAGDFSSQSFMVQNIAAGTEITLEVTCYARGTRIATARGEVEVEALKIGDLVKTLHAGLQKVKWIGTRRYAAPFANHVKVLPVCIKAGALAEHVPARDLYVSPGHAICIDGALIHASRLINGVSITQAKRVDEITYFHVELEQHEVIFAENCPAESFMGEDFRAQFHNAARYRALYPGGRAPEHMCLPRLDSGFQLQAIQRRLARRAGIAAAEGVGPLRGYVDQAGPEICTGWARDLGNPAAPVCLDVFIRGARIGRVLANLFREDLRAAGIGTGEHAFAFRLPPGARGQVELRRSEDGAVLGWSEKARTG